jgi:hypothetical protein
MQKTGALLKERRLGTPSLLDIDSDETRRAFPNQFRSVLLQEPLDRGGPSLMWPKVNLASARYSSVELPARASFKLLRQNFGS